MPLVTRTRKHTETLAQLHQPSAPHLFSLAQNSFHLLHSAKHIYNHTLAEHIHYASAECTVLHFPTWLCSSSPSFAAEPASVAPSISLYGFPSGLCSFICSSSVKQTAVCVQQKASRYHHTAATTYTHLMNYGLVRV